MLLALLGLPASRAADAPGSNANPYYRITVVDEETGRGIPLVRLRTTNCAEYWTDSAGVVAYLDPGMMNKEVHFDIASYGYSYPKDKWFQFQSIRLTPVAGGSAVIKMHRDNVAQRLYRITGSDIYRDSVLLGDAVPPTQDDSPEPVMGQDTAQTTIYKGKLFWIWGDTGVAGRHLGNFKATGATSELPGHGGLDPEKGVSLTYFRKDGRVKPMVNIEHRGPIWLNDLRVVPDESGKDRLIAGYVKVKGELGNAGNGLVIFNDETQQFDHLTTVPEHRYSGGNSLRYRDNGVDYFYNVSPFPSVRSRTDLRSIMDLSSYETMTCLKPGSPAGDDESSLERDAHGNLVWGWKKNTAPAGTGRGWHRRFRPQPELEWFKTIDIDTGAAFGTHGTSVFYNAYRKRWIAVMLENFGKTWLGEIWYAEADTPLGPWVFAKKVATHYLDGYPYTFYNPILHPEFDKDGGRKVFFEGTYTDGSLSAVPYPTPRYNYNQIMYMLELDDPRLFLPVPVYRVVGRDMPHYYATNNGISPKDRDREIAFFACDRRASGTIPVYSMLKWANGGVKQALFADASRTEPAAFFAIPADAPNLTTQTLSITAPLNEFTNPKTGERIYSVENTVPEPGYVASDKPVCRVWTNPLRFNPWKVR